MDAGLLVALRHDGGFLQQGEGLGQVGEEAASFPAVGDKLVEIGGFIKLCDGPHGIRVIEIKGQGIGEMNLGDPQSRIPERLKGFTAIVELHRKMAGIIIDAHPAQEKVGIIGLTQKPIEKGKGVPGIFKMSQRFRFQTEMEIATSFDALIMVFLGGVQSLTGPIAGASVFTLLQDWLSRFEYWRLLLGLLIIFIAILLPGGLAGAVDQVKALLDRAPKDEAAP